MWNSRPEAHYEGGVPLEQPPGIAFEYGSHLECHQNVRAPALFSTPLPPTCPEDARPTSPFRIRRHGSKIMSVLRALTNSSKLPDPYL